MSVSSVLREIGRVVDPKALTAAVVAGYATFWCCRVYHNRNTPLPGTVMADRMPGIAGAIFGWLPPLERVPLEHLLGQLKKHSKADAIYMTMLFSGVVVPSTLKDVLHITRYANVYVKGPEYPLLMGPIVGYTGILLITDDAYHTTVRRKLNPAFATTVADEMADTLISRYVHKVLSNLGSADGEERVVGLAEVVADFSLDVVHDAAFRPELSDKRLSDGRLLGSVTRTMMKHIPLTWYQFLPGGSSIPTPRRLELNRVQRDVGKELHDLVERLAENPAPKSEWVLIDRVVGCGLSDQEMFDNAMTFLLAGFDTTATTLGWLCYELAVNPDVQEKLFEELEQVVPADGVASVAALKKCDYLEAVLQESMRLHSPVLAVTRVTVKDDVLPSGVVIPKGTNLWVPFAHLHTLPSIWGPDAHVFRPERWLSNQMTRGQRDAFMPFSTGKRSCIGKDFAMNELRMFVATLVRRYKFRWPEGCPCPENKNELTAAPNSPVEVLLTRRH